MPLNVTPEQKEAIEHFKGPGLVVAGPGSGKTFVITKRVEFLVNKMNVHPEKIVVTTFTNKAANELKVRLSDSIGTKAAEMQISTIHSLCKKFLEEYYVYQNLGAEFEVLDEHARRLFLQINKFRLGIYRKKKGGWSWLKNKREDEYARLYDFLTRNDVNIEELKQDLKSRGWLDEENRKVLESYEKYLQLLENEKKIDFANLQLKAYKLIQTNEEVLKEIQERFEFILVDEYQDTSPIQDKIFRKLAEPENNIFVVGDENQSIYGFRGASLLNFEHFTSNYPEAETYFLNINFRSARGIVDLSNRLLEEKIKEKLEARRKRNEPTILLKGETVDSVAKEAIELIKKMKEKGIIERYGQVALLFRTWKHAEDYVAHLRNEEIPYVVFGGGGLLDRPYITSMIYLLSYVTRKLYLGDRFKGWDWWNPSSFKSEVLGFSESSKNAIDQLRGVEIYDFKDGKSLREFGFTDEPDIEKIIKLNELRDSVEQSGSQSLLRIFYKILNYTGYLNRLLEGNEEKYEEKLYNLARLSEIVDIYESIGNKIDDFFWFVYYSSDGLDQKEIEDDDTVKVMSVHKAKGLEFPVVFLCSLTEGRFPLSFRESNFMIPIPQDFYMAEEIEQQKERFFEEEERLFYVGITRAQDNLILTTSRKIRKQRKNESRFLRKVRDYVSVNGDLNEQVEKKYKVVEEIPHLNYSAINTYIDCPFRYKLVYKYGFVTPRIYTQSVGIFVHNILQRIHREMKEGNELSEEDIRRFADEYWIPIHRRSKEDQKDKERYIKFIKNYYRFAVEFFDEIIAIEEPFSHIDKNMVVDGRVDLICDIGGNTCLVDFKARELEGIKDTNVDKQLRMYNYCLGEKYGIDKLMAYTFLDNRKTEFEPDNQEIGEFLNDMSEMMKEGKYERRRGAFCKRCEFNFCC